MDSISINDQLFLSNYLGKRIRLRVFGYVAIHSKCEKEKDRAIDFAPLAL